MIQSNDHEQFKLGKTLKEKSFWASLQKPFSWEHLGASVSMPALLSLQSAGQANHNTAQLIFLITSVFWGLHVTLRTILWFLDFWVYKMMFLKLHYRKISG